ncbi:hypothetical protein, partial [Pseudomonas aeruginosa]|uniref:hypothetical protein n=1 Tax=Pseudomonas aeruginosa TaxID=287 RepID=UPI002B228BF1
MTDTMAVEAEDMAVMVEAEDMAVEVEVTMAVEVTAMAVELLMQLLMAAVTIMADTMVVVVE